MVPIISVRYLKKSFRTHRRGQGLLEAIKSIFKRQYVTSHALKGINFSVDKGELVGFIGPNGAGKSTCIKALCGVLHPTEGEVKVMGYTPWTDRERYVKHIGVVFGQKSQLWWDLPAIDTFYLHKGIYEIPEKQFNQRLGHMMKLLEVEDVAHIPVRDMSLGERMKCEAIAALLHNPEVVFFDEPTIGMDVIAKDRLRKFVQDINKKYKTTFIFTTHNMDDIEKLCKRVMIINRGELVYDGLFEDIKRKYVHSKFLNIKFDERIGPLSLPAHSKSLKKTGFEATIEVDITKQRIDVVVEHLIKKFSVADITISDPPIDEIIAEIYASEGT